MFECLSLERGVDREGIHRKKMAVLGRPRQRQLDDQGEGCGWGMDNTGSSCRVYVKGQAARLRGGGDDGDVTKCQGRHGQRTPQLDENISISIPPPICKDSTG